MKDFFVNKKLRATCPAIYRMAAEREKAARSLILRYLESCVVSDPEHAEELTVSLDCLRTIWGIDQPDTIPGVKSIVDLIPAPKYDRDRAVQLKLEGNNALKAGNFDLAMQKYTEAIATDPTEPTFYCNRAAVFTKRNEYQNAINDCEKAIGLDTTYATAYSRLGYAYFQLGQVDKARDAYERGLRACPDNQALKDNLTSIAPEQGTPAPGPGSGDFLSGLFGTFANNPAMMGQIMEKMNSPEMQAVLQDPEMAAFVDEIKANPAAIFAKMGDPRLQKLMAIVMGSGPR